jgi:hypothetical protein
MRPDVVGQRRTVVLEASKRENSNFENIQRCSGLSLEESVVDGDFVQ